jgi:hypothetical protein
MVGGFGLLGMEVMNRRFGQASLLSYSARSLPISEKEIFCTFVVKDTVYYLVLWVLPFVAGFAIASPFIAVPLSLPLLLFLTLTLSFLTGLALIFFLSTVYSRSKQAFAVLFFFMLFSFAGLYLFTGFNAGALFPPLQLLYAFSYSTLLVALAVVIIPSAIAVALFTSEYTDTTKRFKNALIPLTKKLSFFPYPPLAAKDLLDLSRSGSFIGQTLFSFLIPLGLLWFLLSVLARFIPLSAVLLLFAILTGVIASTMYTWLTMFDTFSSYTCLPVGVPALLESKICSFSVLQVIPALFITVVTIASGGIAYLVPAFVLCLSVSFYALAVTIWLTGLSPSVLVYDAKVLLVYLGSVGIVLVALIALAFVNPYYATGALLLLLPAWLLVRAGFTKWEIRDQPMF